MENRIIAIVPFRNASNYIKQCYDSLVDQEYENFKLIFSDDCSGDGSINLIPDSDCIIKIRHEKRIYALANIYNAITKYDSEDEDIVIIVDGDDYLLHNRVFYKINELYQRENCLLSYGQYCTNGGVIGHCARYTKDEFRKMRSLNWRASHLKTFRLRLFNTFLKMDPDLTAYRDENGEFYSMAYDVALMHPMMEIAGYDSVHFNKEVFYVYRLHAMNDMQTNRTLQSSQEKHIQSKRSFERVFFD